GRDELHGPEHLLQGLGRTDLLLVDPLLTGHGQLRFALTICSCSRSASTSSGSSSGSAPSAAPEPPRKPLRNSSTPARNASSFSPLIFPEEAMSARTVVLRLRWSRSSDSKRATSATSTSSR